jgi:hypothetical protein
MGGWMRHKNRCVSGRGVDDPRNWAPIDERTFVKVYTVERIRKMISDKNPKERKNGIEILCDKVNILEKMVKNKEDDGQDYDEFRNSLIELIKIVSDSEVRRMALKKINSTELLNAILGFDIPEDAKRDVREKLEKSGEED